MSCLFFFIKNSNQKHKRLLKFNTSYAQISVKNSEIGVKSRNRYKGNMCYCACNI